MIKATYVTFEQAKLLKEKGFNELCRVFWEYDCTEEENILIEENSPSFINNRENSDISAPEQWQVVEWLRVNHSIYITAQLNHRKKFYWCLDSVGDTSDDYKSPQEAYSSAFDYVLKNLLK